jgi:hypothetical protein
MTPGSPSGSIIEDATISLALYAMFRQMSPTRSTLDTKSSSRMSMASSMLLEPSVFLEMRKTLSCLPPSNFSIITCFRGISYLLRHQT